MFEAAELGQKISKAEYKAQEPALRQRLLEVQRELRDLKTSVLLVFGGVDGAGKGELANLLTSWLDPRGVVTHAFERPTDEETERPRFWRFWRALAPNGQIGIYLSAWYSRPLIDHVHQRTTPAQFVEELMRIRAFETTLADDGVLVLKFWMHLSKSAQKKRFKKLEADPLQKWRVTKRDWKHWGIYDKFVAASEQIITRTSTGEAPWQIVDGSDERYRALRVGTLLLQALERHIPSCRAREALKEQVAVEARIGPVGPSPNSVLSVLDMTQALDKPTYKELLTKYQGRLNLLHRLARERGISTVLVFEGSDAAGKGGAIRRMIAALDARNVRVVQIAAPNDEERQYHYLWRFWKHLSRAGHVLVFDRSWYGRVLVERIEGFATEDEWRRAYSEINQFERAMTAHGTVVLKFWMHITKDEQGHRFEARANTPHKSWKLTDEDLRNREKWDEYEAAVTDMVEQTSSTTAPWVLVEGNDKRFARIRVLKAVCDHLEQVLEVPIEDEKLARKT